MVTLVKVAMCVILSLYTAPPGQPLNLTTAAISDSWVTIQWQAPSNTGSHWISYYNLTVYTLDTNMSTIRSGTENNETHKNITHLHPGTSIKIRVTAISRVGGVTALSPASEPLLVTTDQGTYTTYMWS